jgi:hypothetical protein
LEPVLEFGFNEEKAFVFPLEIVDFCDQTPIVHTLATRSRLARLFLSGKAIARTSDERHYFLDHFVRARSPSCSKVRPKEACWRPLKKEGASQGILGLEGCPNTVET